MSRKSIAETYDDTKVALKDKICPPFYVVHYDDGRGYEGHQAAFFDEYEARRYAWDLIVEIEVSGVNVWTVNKTGPFNHGNAASVWQVYRDDNGPYTLDETVDETKKYRDPPKQPSIWKRGKGSVKRSQCAPIYMVLKQEDIQKQDLKKWEFEWIDSFYFSKHWATTRYNKLVEENQNGNVEYTLVSAKELSKKTFGSDGIFNGAGITIIT